MRTIIDLQDVQMESRFRGIGHCNIAIAKVIIRNDNRYEVFIVLSTMLGKSITDAKV